MNIKRYLKQKAVYWAPAQMPVDDMGNPAYNAPEEIDCRWDDVQKVFIDAQGESRVSNAQIMVENVLKKGGAIMKGMLDDVSDQDNPFANDGVFKIQAWSETPDRRAKTFLRIAMV